MRKIKLLPLLTAAVFLSGCTVRYEYAEPVSNEKISYTRESAGIRLNDDFYGYQNFDFLWNNNIPVDMFEYSYGQIVSRQIDGLLTDEIRRIAALEAPEDSDEQKIKALFLQCLDSDTRSSVGLSPLEKGFNAINSSRSINEFVQACAMIYTEYGCAVLPAPFYSQDHRDSSRNSVFLGQAELFYSANDLLNGKNSAEELQKSIKAALEMTDHENSAALAYDAVTLLLELAENTADISKMTVDELYNPHTQSELSALLSNIDATAMLESFGVGDTESVIVLDPAQTAQVNALLTDEYLPVWKALTVSALLYAYIDYLPEEYSTALNPGILRTNEEKALSTVKELLAEELGRVYVHEYGDGQALSAVTEMTENIRDAYRKCIESSELLSESERTRCLAKIDNMKLNIGYPPEAHRSGTEISGSLLESAVAIKRSLIKENLALSESAPSSEDWSMSPQTFNAFYSPQSNSITVPMASFSVPFFDTDADKYTNLGGLGSIIAHEMGHAFDPEGILYDEYGNYRPEIVSGDRKNGLTAEIEEYFGRQMIMDTFYIDGKQTVHENAADLGGMQVIASMTDDPGELRKIFESYGKIWATLSYDTETAVQLTDDVHSPAEVRVNAVLSSVDGFYDAYEISENDGMYVPYNERVRVW